MIGINQLIRSMDQAYSDMAFLRQDSLQITELDPSSRAGWIRRSILIKMASKN
jgi:hypothetical protein